MTLAPRAWGVSLTAHAAVVALVAAALGVGHRHHEHEPPARRLVWVEPAPPRVGVPAAPAAPPSTAPAPPAVVAAPAPPEPVAPVMPLTRTARPRPPRPTAVRRAAAARQAAEAPGAAVTDASPTRGELAGVAAGDRAGLAAGVGDQPLALRDVASPPELVDRVVPTYPARARALEVEGQVVLEVVLGRDGKPETDIKVLRSVALLDAAAVAAVRQWRFRPARDASGRPVRVVMEVPVRFMLR